MVFNNYKEKGKVIKTKTYFCESIVKKFREKLKVEEPKNEKYDLEKSFTKPVRVYIDTCSLLRPNSVSFVNELAEVAEKQNQKITIFKSVIRELEKISKNQPQMKKRVNDILNKLYELKQKDLLEMLEGKEKLFSDPNFLEALIHDLRTTNVIIVSNDYQLGKAARRISEDIRCAVYTKYKLQVIKV